MRGDAFSATGFADQAEGLARGDLERNAVHGADRAVGCLEVRGEIVDAQQGRHRMAEWGSVASRRPSPRKLKARTATAMNTTGISNQGKCASVWTFCASCNSVPQLTSGGRMPIPRNVSA